MPPELATAPDPATTTTPTPAAGGAAAPDNWDFLDTPDESMPHDPMEFREDTEARQAEEAEKAETPTEETSATPTAEAEPKPEEKPAEEPSAAEPEVAAKATYFDEFDKALRSDPAAVAQAIIDGMDPRQKTSFLKQFVPEGAPATRSEFKVDEYEAQGEMETALKERWSDLETIPTLVSDTHNLARSIEGLQDTFTPHIATANVQAELALAKIQALCEAVGIDLPDPDFKAVEKALGDGKTSYRDAVRKAVSYGKSVEAAKQMRAPRPRTPGNETRKPEPIPEGTSMVEISKRLGYLAGR